VLTKLDVFEPIDQPVLPSVTTTTVADNTPVIYYAVDAAYSAGISETVNAGFTGDAYVNLDNIAGSDITWTVNVPAAGNYLVTIKEANGTDADRSMNVYVNGASAYSIQSFPGTGAWTTWTENSIVLSLKAGTNTIKYVSRTANGGPNLDYLRLETTNQAAAPLYEYSENTVYYAIDAAYEGGMSETTNAGFTGSAYVNLDNNNTSNITWTVEVPQAGNYLCTFNTANGTEADRKMKIEVNGNTESFWVQSFTTTGAWTSWAERAIVLPLVAGANTIKLTSWTENGGPNLDYLRLNLTDEPVGELYDPSQDDDIIVSSNPVVYIAGDSTVQSYRASYAPQQGWGYYLGNYFNENVTVSNHAIAGRSSKSFYDNGRLTTILDSMKEGDYLLVQFGINDSASSQAERYAPVCGNVNNPTEGSFEHYMKFYIEGTLAKGATPILVTTVIGMKAYSGGKFVNSYGNYCQAMKDLAAKYSIPCIDLNSLMVSHYNSVGYDTAKSYHLMGAVEGSTDGTHFCEKGADIVAGIVANAIKGLGIGLSSQVK